MPQQNVVRTVTVLLLFALTSQSFNPLAESTPVLPAELVIVHASAVNSSSDSARSDGLIREPCELVNKLLFDGDVANASVSWQVELGPRTVESNASVLLIDSAIESLTDWGWSAVRDQHSVTFPNGSTVTATNLVAVLPPMADSSGTGEVNAAHAATSAADLPPRVVLAAHYDTKPTADYDLNESLRSSPIPGANDGASGVAVLLELGRVLPMANLSVEVVILLTDVEDHGSPLTFLGAQYWAENLSERDIARTRAFILLDMIGDSDLGIGAESSNSDPELMNLLLSMASPFGAHSMNPDCGGSMSTSPRITSNSTMGIIDDHIAVKDLFPAALLIDTEYGPKNNSNPLGDYWHTMEDSPDKVSAESLGLIGGMVELILRAGLGVEPLPSDKRVIESAAGDSLDPPRNDGGENEALDSLPTNRGLNVAITTSVVAIAIMMLTQRNRAVSRSGPRHQKNRSNESAGAESSQSLPVHAAPEEE